MQIEVEPGDVDTYRTDERGRIYLGTDYADVDEVEIAVVGVSDE